MNTELAGGLTDVAVAVSQDAIDVFPFGTSKRGDDISDFKFIIGVELVAQECRQDFINVGRFLEVMCGTQSDSFKSVGDAAITCEHDDLGWMIHGHEFFEQV